MNNKFTNILLALLFCTFLFQSHTNNASKIALETVRDQFSEGVEDFAKKIKTYQNTIENLTDDPSSIEMMQKAHIQTRLAYKKVEFLIEYLDPLATKKFLNGAPLMSVEPSVPEVIPVSPVGLQVLDEMAFAEQPMEEKQQMWALSKKLEKDLTKVWGVQSKIKLTHRHVFEAIRKELIRVFTLGVTGFDTPSSGNAIPEAKAAMEGIFEAMQAYIPLLDSRDKGLAIVFDARFRAAIQYLEKNTDFDAFNRLQFFKNHIDPLYDLVLDAQKSLDIELPHEVHKKPMAVNYEARSIWDENFLNKNYFAGRNVETEAAKQRAELGKLLFFDPILSKENNRSCASCHQPGKAFTDGLAKSRATGKDTTIQRNSPTLLNAVYAEKYFYDLREDNLERQISHVIMHTEEFGTNFPQLIEKLQQSEEYVEQFNAAYADQPKYVFSKWSIADALANYVASLTSFDSEFDQYVTGKTGVIQPAVERGFNLFMGKASCGTCHFAPTFTGLVPPNFIENETEILGVPATKKEKKMDKDLGRFGSSKPRDKAPFYRHSFKTTTVRNVAETAPYMHNGVYETLEEVVNFYNNGGGEGLGYEVPHQTLPFSELNLTEQEKSDLVAFMEALSDNPFTEDAPDFLPEFENKPEWNKRKIGGDY